MTYRLSQRDDADHVSRPFSIHNDRRPTAEQSEPDPAVLPVVSPVIQTNQHREIEHLVSVGEVNAVLADVVTILIFVPLEPQVVTLTAVDVNANGFTPVRT